MSTSGYPMAATDATDHNHNEHQMSTPKHTTTPPASLPARAPSARTTHQSRSNTSNREDNRCQATALPQPRRRTAHHPTPPLKAQTVPPISKAPTQPPARPRHDLGEAGGPAQIRSSIHAPHGTGSYAPRTVRHGLLDRREFAGFAHDRLGTFKGALASTAFFAVEFFVFAKFSGDAFRYVRHARTEGCCGAFLRYF
jgi:hypothetical protein